MKRINIIMLAFLCMCQSCTQTYSDTDLDMSTSSTIRSRRQAEENKDNEKKEIDWDKVAMADGAGAFTGVCLAEKSGNIWVILASAVGVGAAASVDEYDRQKEELYQELEYKGNDLYDNPNIVNPFHPVLPPSAYRRYALSDSIARMIGEGHNDMVRLALETIDDKHSSTQDKFKHIQEMTEDKFGYKTGLDNTLAIDMIKSLSVDNPYHHYVTSTSPFDVEKLQNTTNEYIQFISDSMADIAGVATLYYSYLQWNRLASNPYTATESIVWTSSDNSCVFLTKQDEIVQTYKSKEKLSLFPSYNDYGAAVLYYYGDKEKESREYIEFDKEYKFESTTYIGLALSIHSGKYVVHHTKIPGIYYICL